MFENIAGLVRQSAKIHPDRTALEFREYKFSYSRVWEYATHICNRLLLAGAQPGDVVALVTERGPDMIFSMLGVLSAGCIYLPIDPCYPQHRMSLMISDSRARFIIATPQTIRLIPDSDCIVIMTNWLTEKDIGFFSAEPPIYTLQHSYAAYIIYTSGSTGTPKGVKVTHGNVINLIQSQLQYFSIEKTERILLFSSYCFDASVEQIFLALFSGAALILFEEGLQLHMPSFEKFIKDAAITHLHATPSFLHTVSRFGFTSLKRVVAGGEVCHPELAKQVTPYHDFYNEYGPTETTVTATIYCCKRGAQPPIGILPVGQPVNGCTVYIVNEKLEQVPAGVSGEIFIGGKGVAVGYVYNEELTNSVFMSDKFSGEGIMYRTGDTGWKDTSGTIFCNGRIDEQIKMRGYRIEPGEIRAAVLESGMVKIAEVIGERINGNLNHITAFIVPLFQEYGFDKQALRSYLSKRLPAYMIPARFCVLNKIPLTTTGKADKKKLEQYAATAQQDSLPGKARNPEEVILSGIWKEIFGTHSVTRQDNFFEFGGNSLLLTQFNRKIEDAFGIRISLTRYFPDFNIERLSEIICDANPVKTDVHHRMSKEGYTSVTVAQEQLFMANRLRPKDPFPNSPVTFRLPTKPDTGKLNEAIRVIVERHESLRTQFLYQEGRVFAKVLTDNLMDVSVIEIKADSIDEEINRITTAFDFSHPPLIRVYLISTPGGEFLHLDMPHICSDGFSAVILSKEIAVLLDGGQLTTPSYQYSYYLQHYTNYMQSESFSADKEFWSKAGLDCDLGKPEPFYFSKVDLSRRGKSVVSKLNYTGKSEFLNNKASSNHNIPVEMLLAAALLLANSWGMGQKIRVMIPVHNRTFRELENITGLLVNTIVVPFEIRPDLPVGEFLSYISYQLREAMLHQQYPFELVQKGYRKKRQTGPIMDMFFNYHNYLPDIVTSSGKWIFYVHAKDREMLPLSIDVFGINCSTAMLRILSASTSCKLSDLDRMKIQYQQLLNWLSVSLSVKLEELLPVIKN
jgi:amino acid adenylation domain-containing protein